MLELSTVKQHFTITYVCLYLFVFVSCVGNFEVPGLETKTEIHKQNKICLSAYSWQNSTVLYISMLRLFVK